MYKRPKVIKYQNKGEYNDKLSNFIGFVEEKPNEKDSKVMKV
jgi:hypothetical protein